MFPLPCLAFLTCAFPPVLFLHRKLRGRKNGAETNQRRWFWSSATAGVCCVFLWLIGSVSLHGEHLDLTILGRFPFVLKCILKLRNIVAVLIRLSSCWRLPCLCPIVHSWFYSETSVELLLLPSLSRKLVETVPACLLLHPEVNVSFLVATPEAREHDSGSGV